MNVEKINSLIYQSVDCIAKQYDFEKASIFIDDALDEIGDARSLMYYDVLNNILLNSIYYIQHDTEDKEKAKKCYRLLLRYYSTKFSHIDEVEVNALSEQELGLANRICCLVNKNILTISGYLRDLYVNDGIYGSFLSNQRYINEIVPYCLAMEKASVNLLKKYKTENKTILENINIWEKDLNGRLATHYC